MNPIPFPRETTQILKGIALALMIVHHTCTPDYWSEAGSTSYALWESLQSVTKMCVYIFAFLVGYGFFCSQNKTLRYSAKRIVLLCIPFWVMLFCLFIPSAYISGKLPEALGYGSEGGGNLWLLELVYNMFGISESLNWYSWFVCFYVLTMLTMPFLHKFCVRYHSWGWLMSIGGSFVLLCIIHAFPHWNASPILQNFFVYTHTIPLTIVGYQCGAWNNKGLLPRWFEGKNRFPWAFAAILLVAGLKLSEIPTMGFCIQAFYIPFLVFAIIGLCNSFKLMRIRHMLIRVGNLSMYMWFFHAIFFTDTVNLYAKNLVFEPYHNFLHTFMMTFFLTYIGASLFQKALTPIVSRIK